MRDADRDTVNPPRRKDRPRIAVLALGAAILLALAIASPPTLAHGAGAPGSDFLAGAAHPISGWDHVLAMVAVGLWGAFLGLPAIWLLPVVFPMVMALGGAAGVADFPLPRVEAGIALSAIVLGLCILTAWRAPLAAAAVLVGLFAIFHGHAHGSELPVSANPVAFAVGFVVATGLLHLSGIAFGLLVRWPAGRLAVRAAGGVIALAGLAFLTGAV